MVPCNWLTRTESKMAEQEIPEAFAESHSLETKLDDSKKLQFCKELEMHPCLWDSSATEYRNRETKLKASEALAEKMKIDSNTLKSLLHGLRTGLIREVKKEQEGKVSKWKFYGPLSFMKNDIIRSIREKENQEWSPEENERLIDFYRDNERLRNHNISSYKDKHLRDLNMKKNEIPLKCKKNNMLYEEKWMRRN